MHNYFFNFAIRFVSLLVPAEFAVKDADDSPEVSVIVAAG